MANPCGCGDSNPLSAPAINTGNVSVRQDQPVECPAIVNETVCVQADVTITPVVNVGTIQSFCVNGPAIGACPGTPSLTGTCSFTVHQSICVQVPLIFSATATAEPTGIVCGTPGIGPCSA